MYKKISTTTMSQKTQTYHWIQKVKKWKKKKEKKRDRIDERKHEWVKKGIKEKELEVKRGRKNRRERENGKRLTYKPRTK